MVAQFVDISAFQGSIDFSAYCAWARQGDGIARIAIKATEGDGFIDPAFATNRTRALAAGIDEIYYYHFARPDLGNSAIAEANFQRRVVGDVRPQDQLILDFEVNAVQATSDWAYNWLVTQQANYGKLPGIYASTAYIQQRLQDIRLEPFALWEANWQFTPDERPPVPFPWKTRAFLQYTDNATNIPGIPGTVDANIFLGKEPTMSKVPAGWSDNGAILKAPDGIPVKLGFRDHILNSNWDPNNIPLEPEQHLVNVEMSNTNLGPGQVQTFRWKRLEYTPKTGILEGWLGQELVWYQKQYAKLQTQNSLLLSQVADLQAQLSGNTLAQENAALLAKIELAVKDLQS